MPTRDVKYWKRISEYVYAPHSTSAKERGIIMARDSEAWCSMCKAIVEPDGKLDATGITNICPFCCTEL